MPKKRSPSPSPALLARFKEWGKKKAKRRYYKRVQRPRLKAIYGMSRNLRIEIDGISRPFSSYTKAFRWLKVRLEPRANMDELDYLAHLATIGVEVYGGYPHAIRSMDQIGMLKLTVLKKGVGKWSRRPGRIMDVTYRYKDIERRFKCRTRLDIYAAVRAILFPSVQPTDITYRFALSSVLNMPVPREASAEEIIDLLVTRRIISIKESVTNGNQ